MKLLLAIDHSRPSATAVSSVLARPWPKGSVIRVLSCTPLTVPIGMADAAIGSAFYLSRARQISLERARNLSESVAMEFSLNGVNAHAVIREGDPATMIVDEASDWGADLIVIGTHGYTGFKKLFYGSVAQKVVGRAPCSVEVVKRPSAIKFEKGRRVTNNTHRPIKQSSAAA